MMKRTIPLALGLLVCLATLVIAQSTVGFFTYLRLGSAAATKISTGTGTPESVVTGAIGDTFHRTDGSAGTTFYVKESGSGNTGWIAPSTLASTTTFTNKTIDAEGTGNVVTVPFTQWIQAARCDNITASSPEWSFPTSNPGAPACQTGTNTQYGTMDFADGGAALSAQTHLRLPNDFISTVTAKFVWFTSATTGDVVWQLATICVADAETSDPAFNAASTVTDTAKGTTLQFNDASITTVTITGCAAGETMFLKLTRDPAHASDTLAATARLVGVELTTRRSM